MKTYPLRVFVKRVLLVRLAVVTIGAALIGGAATFFLSNRRCKNRSWILGVTRFRLYRRRWQPL